MKDLQCHKAAFVENKLQRIISYEKPVLIGGLFVNDPDKDKVHHCNQIGPCRILSTRCSCYISTFATEFSISALLY